MKESIKAISVQADDPHKLLEWDEDSEIMGEAVMGHSGRL